MRAIAISVWVFINLGFLGMCGYMYLIFSQYWYHATKQTHFKALLQRRSTFNRENQVVFYEPDRPKSQEDNSLTVLRRTDIEAAVRKRSHPRHKPDAKKLVLNSTDKIWRSERKLTTFKNDLLVQLRRVLHEESSVFKTDNPYYVNYNGPRGTYQDLTSEDLRCLLKDADLRTLTRQDPPFNRLEFGNMLGDGRLFGDRHFRSCGIVSNAGSLFNSGLGTHVDDHDVVVRFNHAPTESYEDDVGTKTTLRIVNSQVVTKEEFQFTSNVLYKNVTVVVWDPSNYSASLQQWYEKPDFDFFGSWAKHRVYNPESNSFILDPRSIWRIWDYIQSLINQRIRRNPPSSGFLGLALMLPHCDYVDMYEFVPSIRLTKKCHYFDEFEDTSCTFGVWHPLAAEKLLSLAMNEVNDTTVFRRGFVRIRGYRDLKC